MQEWINKKTSNARVHAFELKKNSTNMHRALYECVRRHDVERAFSLLQMMTIVDSFQHASGDGLERGASPIDPTLARDIVNALYFEEDEDDEDEKDQI